MAILHINSVTSKFKSVRDIYVDSNASSQQFFLALPAMPYARICLIDRQRLVNSYNTGRDWRRLAIDLGIKRTTANLILKRYQEENWTEYRARGGARHVKVSEQMLQALHRYVAEKLTITLNEM